MHQRSCVDALSSNDQTLEDKVAHDEFRVSAGEVDGEARRSLPCSGKKNADDVRCLWLGIQKRVIFVCSEISHTRLSFHVFRHLAHVHG
jgi:hypothetical protein